MGGEGSGRKPDPITLMKGALNYNNANTAVVSSVTIPNLSGVQAAVRKDFNQTQTLTTGKITLTQDNSTADTAYVPMVLYNTDATPPAANTVPIGTIYIQYTA